MGVPAVLLAPTGRAAKVMSRYAGRKAYTIHKKIYRQKTLASAESHFSLDYNKQKNAVFIVDEASMLSNYSPDGSLFGSGQLLDDLVTYVELLGTAFQIEKGIGLDRVNPVETEIPGSTPDEVVMHRIDFDRNDRSGPPRGKLVADRAGPGKQVEHVGTLDVAMALDHIEQIFLGEVGRRTGPQIFRRLYDPAAKDAANDSHNTFGLRTHTGTNLPYVRPSREARA